MAIGNQSNAGNVGQTLTTLAVAMRDLATSVLEQQAFLNKIGLAGLQQPPFSFSPGDAQAVLDAINHMATPMQVYKGTASQGSAFNFEDSLTILWGGQ